MRAQFLTQLCDGQALNDREALLISFNVKACGERLEALQQQEDTLLFHQSTLSSAVSFCEKSLSYGGHAEGRYAPLRLPVASRAHVYMSFCNATPSSSSLRLFCWHFVLEGGIYWIDMGQFFFFFFFSYSDFSSLLLYINDVLSRARYI